MCDENCSSGPIHARECEILSRCKHSDRPINLRFDESNFEKENNAYAIITPLRLLLLQEANDDKWRRSNQLMDHHEGKMGNFVRIQNMSDLSSKGFNFMNFYEFYFRSNTKYRRVDVVRKIYCQLFVTPITLNRSIHIGRYTTGHRTDKCECSGFKIPNEFHA